VWWRCIVVSSTDRPSAVLQDLVLATSRHLLQPAQWARTRLAEHVAKSIRIDLLTGPLSLQIAADGYLEAADPAAAPDLVIQLTPVAAAKWLTDREAGWRAAQVDGDMELAAAVSHVAANLRWDYEEDMSQVLGDVTAHRLASAMRRLSAWPAAAAESFGRGVAEYLSEERRVLATPLAVQDFTSGVDELRDEVERLAKRIDRLERLAAESSSH
jgi:ubiquinone biosynthesis protein UbiJ